MKIYKNLYSEVCSIQNLVLAWRKARKGKTKKHYVQKFEKNLGKNIKSLHNNLKCQTYKPRPLKTFILRDPKTRKISKSHFRDRIVHHAIVNILEPIYEKSFIFDNCACRKGKGSLLALNRFRKFQRKVTNNLTSRAYCLKADIKQYFREVNHNFLIAVLRKKISDEEIISLIKLILKNNVSDNPIGKGMPLGNLTSQFFANVYLNELDQFVKNKLGAKYYIRYVDDFVLLDSSEENLRIRGGGDRGFFI
ncbi:MAG: reverse transcriptase domain-containing protein [Nanoarchaeota archaeon]